MDMDPAMAFWQGDAFKPPVKLDLIEAMEDADGFYAIFRKAVKVLNSAFLEERAPVAFVHGIDEGTDVRTMVAVIIDKVLCLVGEVL